TKAPIFEALLKYNTDGIVPMHVPAHKQGRFCDPAFRDFIGQNVLDIDLTLTSDLDHFHDPRGPFKLAEELAADAHGADAAYFLINGTSGGVQAMIMAVCKPNDKILVPRNVHKSVLAGLIFTGAVPVYIEPEHSGEWDFAFGIKAADVEAALDADPEIKAVFVVNPTYFGVVSELIKIVEVCRRRDVLVLADEAHGGHLYFGEKGSLPLSAMEAGCDMSAISTHKMSGSFTQSSTLLVRDGEREVRGEKPLQHHKIRELLAYLQTTSPSYILLASLDTARREMALNGQEHVRRTIQLANYARQELNKVGGCKVMSIDGFDPTKLVISSKECGIIGRQLMQDLRRAPHNIELEMSFFFGVLALITIGDTKETVDKLINAAKSVFSTYSKGGHIPHPKSKPPFPKMVLTPREAYFGGHETEVIPFNQSFGRVCAEAAMSYPPGIPIIAPGERICTNTFDHIKMMHEYSMNFQGPQDTKLHSIKVYKNL
ncbi:MAG: aminotransferase class I/II-fold pyridoxal phosphate-dependent enzyme, partial [Defluviitaleaceae bacterium]|nr:aminotransferase class I/II-fold pyridoxal phosphate-dependent enzyme [Defluviitaleaceae bacterium]